MYVESPVCWPTARLLDWLLGASHSHHYRRNELKTLIELHSADATNSADEGLSELEVGIVTSALGLRDRSIGDCMKKVEDIYTVNDGMRICDVDLKQVSSLSLSIP